MSRSAFMGLNQIAIFGCCDSVMLWSSPERALFDHLCLECLVFLRWYTALSLWGFLDRIERGVPQYAKPWFKAIDMMILNQ